MPGLEESFICMLNHIRRECWGKGNGNFLGSSTEEQGEHLHTSRHDGIKGVREKSAPIYWRTWRERQNLQAEAQTSE